MIGKCLEMLLEILQRSWPCVFAIVWARLLAVGMNLCENRLQIGYPMQAIVYPYGYGRVHLSPQDSRASVRQLGRKIIRQREELAHTETYYSRRHPGFIEFFPEIDVPIHLSIANSK